MVSDTLKKCRICLIEKSLDSFYPHKGAKDFLRSECVECTLKVNLAYARKHPELVKRIKRKSWFKYKYGISPETVDDLISKQNNKCWICREEVPLEVDHDHINGSIRGLLCTKCNKGLGLFKDNLVNLLRAFLYLMKRKLLCIA